MHQFLNTFVAKFGFYKDGPYSWTIKHVELKEQHDIYRVTTFCNKIKLFSVDIELPVLIDEHICSYNFKQLYMVKSANRPMFTTDNEFLFINDYYNETIYKLSADDKSLIAKHGLMALNIPSFFRSRDLTVSNILQQTIHPNHYDASTFRYFDGRGYIVTSICKAVPVSIEAFNRGNKDIGRRIKTAVATAINSYLFQYPTSHELDFKDKIILPSYHQTNAESYFNTEGLDLATTTNENAGKIAYLTYNTYINTEGQIVPSEYIHGEVLSSVPFIASTEAHRLPIVRTITQSLRLNYPDQPLLTTNVINQFDSCNLLTLRADYIHNTYSTMEDSLLISESAARRMSAIKKTVQTIDIPANKSYILLCDENVTSYEDIVLNNDLVPKGSYVLSYDIDKQEPVNVKAGISKPSAIESITVNELVINGQNIRRFTITYLTNLPIEIGSKLVDAYSNKGTVGAIIPDNEMPLVTYIDDGQTVTSHCELIRPRAITKRCTPSVILEEKYSMAAKALNCQITIENAKIIDNHIYKYTIDTANTVLSEATGSLTFEVDVPRLGTVHTENVGFVAVYRLDHNPSEKLSYSSDIVLNHNGMTYGSTGNFRYSDAMITWAARKADKLVNYISSFSNKSHQPELLRSILFILGYTQNKDQYKITNTSLMPQDKIVSFFGPEIVTISNKLNDEVKEKYLFNTFANVDESIVEHTILDPKIGNSGAMFQLPTGLQFEYTNPISKEVHTTEPNSFIAYPPHLAGIVFNNNQQYVMSPLQKAFNIFIAECHNWEKLSSYKNWPDSIEKSRQTCSKALNNYLTLLMEQCGGKNGLIRSIVYPRINYSMYAVVSSNIDLPLDTVSIPKKVYDSFCKSNDFNVEEGSLVVVTRFPAHNTCNSVAMRFVLNNTNCIIVNPAVLHLFDGDLDGDCFSVFFVNDKEAYEDLQKIHITHEIKKYFSPGKELTNANPNTVISTLTNLHGNVNDQSYDKVSPLWNEFVNTSTIEVIDYRKRINSAMLNYYDRKALTAFMGSISNDIIYVTDNAFKHNLIAALELRHAISQMALNAKHGEAGIAYDLKECFFGSQRTSDAIPYIEKIDEPRFSNSSKQFVINLLNQIGKMKVYEFINNQSQITHVGSLYMATKDASKLGQTIKIGKSCFDSQFHQAITI